MKKAPNKFLRGSQEDMLKEPLREILEIPLNEFFIEYHIQFLNGLVQKILQPLPGGISEVNLAETKKNPGGIPDF